MTTDRRDWLSRSALAAVLLGTPRRWHHRVLATLASKPRPYLDLAIDAARWIDRCTETVDQAARWPADPLKPEGVGLDFYNGMPGVVTFFAALHAATGDRHWLDRAIAGADYLATQVDRNLDQIDNGLYTGLAGLGYTLLTVEQTGGGARFGAAARRAAAAIAKRGVATDSNDIISGMAGTGLFLLDVARRWKDRDLSALAAAAGDQLIHAGEAAEGGTMWFPAKSFRRNYPNFSHGTAGVSYFLATLHQQSGERRFLDAALRGAAYLDAVATRRDGATTIFHQSGGGEGRFYLSWCHGPVGTARLFYRLHQISGERKWADWVDSLTRGVITSGAPEQRSDGYWNNISQCCGNVGIGQYCIDLTRHHRSGAALALRERVVTDTMRRAIRDEGGLRWVQAENRTQPENLVAQTGFMQGAAGVGTFFLQLDALAAGSRWRFPQPDTPFA